jgi:ATP-dependent DNA helicase DinG
MEKSQRPKLTVIQGGKTDEPVIDPRQRAEPVFIQDRGNYIRDVFGHQGHLAELIPGYKARRGQVMMAKSVDAVIRSGRHLIVEGPTGTGKSLAYAVPAAYHAAHNNLRVCIVTANKTLQSQIYEKDLNTLSRAVPWRFSYSIRKGLGNFLCKRDYKELIRNPSQVQSLFSEDMSQEDEVLLQGTFAWADKTKDGDRDNSPGVDDEMWKNFSTNGDKCDGGLCAYSDSCFSRKAKATGNEAQVIVTNYHLLFTHMRIPGACVLPGFDVVILDEAHRARGIARDFFGDTIAYKGLTSTVAKLRGIKQGGTRLVKNGKEDKKGKPISLSEFGFNIHTGIIEELDTLWKFLAKKVWDKDLILHETWTIDSEALEIQLKQAGKLLSEVGEKYMPKKEDKSPQAQKMRATAVEYLKAGSKCTKRSDDLEDFRKGATKGKVYFITPGKLKNERMGDPKLESKMVDVSAIMNHYLFKPHRTVVQTSATLAIKANLSSGSDFDYVKKEMGMDGLEVEEQTVATPFDYKARSILVIPKDMPKYAWDSKEWEDSVCDNFVKIVGMVGGKTLGLFTSYRVLHIVKDRLRKMGKFEVLVQGEGTNKALSKQFQEDVNCILLGTKSFSEGVSFEGEACSCVIVDKLPFIPPGDPIAFGIKKRFMDSGDDEKRAGSRVFTEYRLPEAIIDFKQRVGRLIRTETDYGVAVLLDNRLHTEKYRQQFMRSVAFDRVHSTINVIPGYMRKFKAL